MQFLGYFVDVAVYCFFAYACSTGVAKELIVDYGLRREMSKAYAVLFLPCLLILLAILLANTIYMAHQCSQFVPWIKSYYYYISPYLKSQVFLWFYSILALIGYYLLKFIYHFGLRREIEKRKERILNEIEGLVVEQEELNKTPNHIEYL